MSTRIENLLSELGSAADIRVQRQAEELVRLLTQLYGGTLERIVDILQAEDREDLRARLTEDELVASVLMLHNLHGDRATGDAAAADQELSEVGTGVENLLNDLVSTGDTRVQEPAEELVGLLSQLYGDTLTRIVDIIGAEAGDGLRTRLTEDSLVASLLVLHDLHPEDTMERVHRALERVRPYLGSHAGGVQLLGIDDETVVHLQLEGNCDGCPSSSATVKYAIEGAINELAPEVSGVEVEDSSTNGGGSARAGHGHTGGGGTQSAVIPVGSLFRECPVPEVPQAPEVGAQS